MEFFTFCFFTFFAGILGVMLGGPFRIFIVENDLIESPIARAVFGFVFFPPVIGVAFMILYLVFSDNPQLGPPGWGSIIGLISGMTYSFRQVGKSEE